MIDPLTISAILGGGKSLFGLGQMLFNKEPERPTYQRPSEISQIVGLARHLASQRGLPAQDLMERDLASTTSQNVRAIQDTTTGGAALGAVANAYNNQMRAQNNLNVQGAQYNAQMNQGLQRALGISAQYADQEFEYNQNMPYQRKLQEFYNNKVGGMQNLFGGMMDITSAIGMQEQNQQFDDMMQFLYGGRQAPFTMNQLPAGQVDPRYKDQLTAMQPRPPKIVS